MPKSTRKPRSRKAAADRPKKPYPDFPLYAHPLGYWSKKIKGTIRHFGRWGRRVNGRMTPLPYEAGWQAALTLYKAQAVDWHAGRTPRKTGDGLTVGDLCNRFLTAKLRQQESGEIAARTFSEYRGTTDRLVATFGRTRLVDDLASDDFESLRAAIAKQWGPVRLGNEVQRVRTVFKYGYEAGLIEKPVRFGPQFVKPSKHVLRKHRAKAGQRMFEPTEVRALLDAASPQLRAMILLGVNAGFGNHDCGTLPLSALDLNGGWIRFPRPKTGIERRCPMWPETADALRAAIAERPTPKDPAHADLVFVTKHGRPWSNGGSSDAVTQETGKLLRRPRCPECGAINAAGAERCGCGWESSDDQPWTTLHRAGLGFYALRHTFRTIADATRDFPAVRLVMGHADSSIDDVYREHVADARLRAVTDHVREWLYGEAASGQSGDGATRLRVVG